MQAIDLVIKGGSLWAGPDKFWPRGAVAASGGKIVFAGDEAQALPAPDAKVIKAHGGLIMPGLVNAHCHGPMTLFRGLADDMPLEVWHTKHMFPAEVRWIDEDATELCTLLAAAEMLLSGTTTVLDAYFCPHGIARAYEQAGMRALVCQGLIDFPAPGVPDPEDNLLVCREFVESWQGKAELITPGIFAHSPYTCSPDTLAGAAELAADLGCLWFTHLSETQKEYDDCLAGHGLTPVARLEELGLLASLTSAAHCIWLGEGDAELLAQRQVGAISCPSSNSKLASGSTPQAELLAAGCAVGLGTDGAASNNNLDMFGEMGLAARLAKLVSHDPAALPASQVLDMALTGSAACMGMSGLVGRLAEGHACDVVVLAGDAPRFTPIYDAASHVVYAGSGELVRQVVVNGRQVVADGRVTSFDLDQVMARVRGLAARVAAG